jgi:uncharacterized protein
MFKRKIYDKLVEWKNKSNGNSAILIEGARRVGKTTVAIQFGEKEFESYYKIDFSRASKDVIECFDDLSNIDSFFESLFLALKIKTLKPGSLFIFDEIQFCPKARQAIKALVEDKRYFYLETGSLVSIKENLLDILIPSEEDSLEMYPLDFEEFLWALDLSNFAIYIKNKYSKKEAFDDKSHRTLIKLYRTYIAVGGMPKVVDTYVTKHDFYEVEKEKRNIIKLYKEDLKKIDNKYGTICSLVWDKLPEMLSKHSTKFIFNKIKKRSNTIIFNNTLEKLTESKIVIPVFKSSDPNPAFSLTKDSSQFKLFYLDTGIFTSIIYKNNLDDAKDIYNRLIFNNINSNLGMLFENAALITLKSNGYSPYYYSWYTKNNKTIKRYEIDLMIYKKGKIIPFEIKSNSIRDINSLIEFKNKYKKSIKDRYVISLKNYDFKDEIIYLPFYMLMEI